MVSFYIETLNSGANPALQNSFMKYDVTIAAIENLLKMTILNKRLNKKDMKKVV